MLIAQRVMQLTIGPIVCRLQQPSWHTNNNIGVKNQGQIYFKWMFMILNILLKSKVNIFIMY